MIGVATLTLMCALSAAPPAEEVLALVVGNNKSLKSTRPDLRYADDDAIKYRAVFRALTADDNIHVLARADEESMGLWAVHAEVNGPPSRAALREGAQRLGALARTAREQGRRSRFFLVFAGHGDVEGGRGMLELEDAAIGKADLEDVIRTVGADGTHVLLDACNSFFVIHPRRPGGRVWATAADLTGGLAVGNSRVGVFLSTSAEAQVFEWTQLQGGIFSHAVRSGLLGAADADGDERITYAELEGFVATAARAVVNPLYRPRLYAAAPPDDVVMVDLRTARVRRLELEGFPGRLTLRENNGTRLVDVHPEGGFSPRVLLPNENLTVTAEVPGPDGAVTLLEMGVPAEGRMNPDTMAASSTAPRGSPALFEQLFSAPFGPRALQEHQARRRAEPPPVYGLDEASTARLETLLDLHAGLASRRRMVGALTLAAFGVVMAAAVVPIGLLIGAAMVSIPQLREAVPLPPLPTMLLTLAVSGVVGAVVLGVMEALAVLQWVRPTELERTQLRYREAAANSSEARAARLVGLFDGLAQHSRSLGKQRIVAAAVGLGTALAALLALGPGTIAVGALVGFVGPKVPGAAVPESPVLAATIALGGICVMAVGAVTLVVLPSLFLGPSEAELVEEQLRIVAGPAEG